MSSFRRSAGKYGDDDGNEKPPSLYAGSSRSKQPKRGKDGDGDVYEDAVGLTRNDVPELVHDTDRKETVEERDRRLKQEAKSSTGANVDVKQSTTTVSEGPELIPDNQDIPGRMIRTETVEEQDARLKKQAMAGVAKGEQAELVAPGAIPAMAGYATTKKSSAVDTTALKGKKSAQQQPELANTSREPDFETPSNDIEAPAPEPSPPQDLPRPGAVRVQGINGPANNNEDDDFGDERTAVLPIGMPVEEDDDEEQGQEDDPALFSDLVRAEEADPDEVFKKRGGILGWVESHPKTSIVLVLLVIGGTVGGVVGGLAGSSPSPAPVPSSAPTSMFEGQVFTMVSNFTPISVLMDESTPQNAAYNFLLQDEGNFDIDNEQKTLQRYALATIYYATSGNTSWIVQADFLSSSDECEWGEELDGFIVGVRSCNEEGLIDILSLADNNLNGTLPNEIGLLAGVELFYMLGNSQLGGTLPASITTLPNIADIRIGRCQFTGTLPETLGMMTGLTNLAIESNLFSGTLPPSIGNLTLLDQLIMTDNRISGSIPSEIGGLALAEAWWAENNRLSGSVPTEVAGMANLRILHLEKNDLTDGMDNFCTDDIAFLNTFRSDCLESSFPPSPAEVSCSCCSACCNDVLEGCL